MFGVVNQIIDIDIRLRRLFRLLVESLLFLAIYIVWVQNYYPFPNTMNMPIHLINFVLWVILYKFLKLDQDHLRFSSLASYYPIIGLSICLYVFFLIEIFLISNNYKFVEIFFLTLVLANTLIVFRILPDRLSEFTMTKIRIQL